MADLIQLPCRNRSGLVHVVVEAPRGSLAKLKYDPELGAFLFQRALPLGLVYPYDWGFVSGTRADDGDPLDAMVISDSPTWPGVVIASRPIGVVRLVQRQPDSDRVVRNDRIIAVRGDDDAYRTMEDLPKHVAGQLEEFFVTAGEAAKKSVSIEGWDGPAVASKLIDHAAATYAQHARVG